MKLSQYNIISLANKTCLLLALFYIFFKSIYSFSSGTHTLLVILQVCASCSAALHTILSYKARYERGAYGEHVCTHICRLIGSGGGIKL